MDATQFAARALQVKKGIVAGIRAELPSECKLLSRFIFSGVTTEEDWLTTLRGEDDLIRIAVVLMADLSLDTLAKTKMGNQFNPLVQFNVELYHEYKLGTETVNTEQAFIEDAAKISFALGKNRAVMSVEDSPQCVGIITRASMRLGMRPSKLTTLHYGKGQINVDMRDLPYTG